MGADDKKKTELREITLEEVAKHNTAGDTWVVLHGRVIEVRGDLIEEHPGGPEVIFALGGKDATSDFEDIGHSDKAREWADKYVIGWTPESKLEKEQVGRIPRNSDIQGDEPALGVAPLVGAIAIAIGVYIYYTQK